MILVPAYGRDYKTATAVKKDWEAGNDFKICDVSSRWNGSYTSIRDYSADDAQWKCSYIRYNHLENLTFIGKWK